MKKQTAEEILEAKFRFQSCMPIQEGMQKRLILEAMNQFAEQDKWIDVTPDTLPNEKQDVLGLTEYGRIIHTDYEQFTNKDKEWFLKTFIKWQPLPKTPTK